MVKIILIGIIWDGLGDYIFTKYISNSISNYEHDIYFVIKDKDYKIDDNIKKFLNNSFEKFKIIYFFNIEKTLKNILKGYSYIFSIAALYNIDNIFNIINKYYPSKIKNYRRIFDFGTSKLKYYKSSINTLDCKESTYLLSNIKEIKYNIYTGFSKESLGIQINIKRPDKNFVNLFKSYNLFTCYYRTDDYIIRYVKFINYYINIIKKYKNPLIFVQGNNNSFLKIAKYHYKLDKYNVYKFDKCYIINSFVSLEESIELFCYSNILVGCQGNSSLSLAINYNKIPLLEWRENLAQSYCLLINFLNSNNYSSLIYLFTFLYYESNINYDNIFRFILLLKNSINVYKNFTKYMKYKYSLNKNFKLYIEKMINNNDYV